MRLALLHAILPASRLNGYPGRIATLRISHGRVKLPAGGQWRERNPWLAFEDAFRLVRGFVQRLEGAPAGSDAGALRRGLPGARRRAPATSSCGSARRRRSGPWRPRPRLSGGHRTGRGSGSSSASRRSGRTRSGCRSPTSATAWVLGREAASLVPIEALLGHDRPRPWGWQSAQIRRAYEAAAPILARDARAILILEPGGPEGLLAAVLGGVGAGYRLVAARLAEPGEETGGIVEFVPPGAAIPVGPRTRGQRRPAGRARWPRRSGHGPRPRPVRAARALRSRPVLRAGRGPDRDRDGRRDPPGPGRAGPDRAPAGRDPGRPGSGRPPPPAGRARRSTAATTSGRGRQSTATGRSTRDPGDSVPRCRTTARERRHEPPRRILARESSDRPAQLGRLAAAPPASLRGLGRLARSGIGPRARGGRRGRPGRAPADPDPRRAGSA